MSRRTDRAELLIAAPREQIYSALLDPEALETWLPPDSMRGRVLWFDARPGGGFRMELTYLDGSRGKSSAQSDITEVTFVELRPAQRVVQQVVFDSEDPAFAGTMTMTWSLFETANGSVVEVRADDVPHGISPSDHAIGLAASLDNLAAYVAATPTRPGESRRRGHDRGRARSATKPDHHPARDRGSGREPAFLRGRA